VTQAVNALKTRGAAGCFIGCAIAVARFKPVKSGPIFGELKNKSIISHEMQTPEI